MTALSFHVSGRAAPQGSKRHVGRGIMVESSKRVTPWRIDVKHAVLDAIEATGRHWTPITGPVCVEIYFTIPRPKAHYRTGRNAHLLRDNAPLWVTSRGAGDLDKLTRAIYDALGSAGVFVDDSQVAQSTAQKAYGPAPGGAQISVRTLETKDNA